MSDSSQQSGGINPAAGSDWEQLETTVRMFFGPARKAPKTLYKMLQALHLLKAKSATLAGVNAATICGICDAMAAAGRKPITINSLLKSIRSLLNFACRHKLLAASPFTCFEDFKVIDDQPRRVRHLSADELDRILAQADAEAAEPFAGGVGLQGAEPPGRKNWCYNRWKALRRRALVYLLVGTGLRKMEALCLRWSDVDLDRLKANVTGRDSRPKTPASCQPVYFPRQVAAVLRQWQEIPHPLRGKSQKTNPKSQMGKTPGVYACGSPGEFVFPQLSKDRPWVNGDSRYRPLEDLRRLAARAGVEGFTLHGLRHSWATHAESRWGLTVPQIQRQLRHSSPLTQLHYRHADDVNLANLMAEKSLRVVRPEEMTG